MDGFCASYLSSSSVRHTFWCHMRHTIRAAAGSRCISASPDRLHSLILTGCRKAIILRIVVVMIFTIPGLRRLQAHFDIPGPPPKASPHFDMIALYLGLYRCVIPVRHTCASYHLPARMAVFWMTPLYWHTAIYIHIYIYIWPCANVLVSSKTRPSARAGGMTHRYDAQV